MLRRSLRTPENRLPSREVRDSQAPEDTSAQTAAQLARRHARASTDAAAQLRGEAQECEGERIPARLSTRRSKTTVDPDLLREPIKADEGVQREDDDDDSEESEQS